MSRLSILLLVALGSFGCAVPYAPPPSSWAIVSPPQVLGADGRVYSQDECLGAVVNDQCQSAIMPAPEYHETCYGEWILGECTGPQF